MRVPKVSLKFLRKFLKKNTDNGDPTASETLEEEVSSPKGKKRSCAPEPPEECPICHDPVGLANPEGIVESWTKLYCGHKFGTHCIQTWLQESINRDQNASPSCPICRATAKHPCGHLISPPLFPSIQLNWQAPRPPPAPPQRRQPVRRRLTRRAGHPLRPPPQPLRRAQVVGECKTCAENAEFDARVHKLRERQERQQRQQTGESVAGTSSRSAAAIKAIIPGLKRSTHTVRTTVVHMGIDPHPEGGRLSRVTCYGNTTQISSRNMSRRPTPPPSYSTRRLSI
ncbi:hypothetical protein GGR53DRAFT_468041 [Hypoxylon sp. FL1150]|nr:hypothetical protein GGR53DRAFT_468041 [Hypoxylon sp. FL1150]